MKQLEEITAAFWNGEAEREERDVFLADAPGASAPGHECAPEHLSCVMAKITPGFDRAIGYLWVLCESSQRESHQAGLESAVNLIGLKTLSVKASSALEFLAKPTWIESTATKRTAVEVAQTCQRALSCMAVIVWEIDTQRQMLKTIGTAGNARNVIVDMKIGEGVAGKCASDNLTFLIDDLSSADDLQKYGVSEVKNRDVLENRHWRSAVFVPLDAGGETVGVFAAYAQRPRGFSILDTNIVCAFAQRLCASYIHLRRLEELIEIERKLELEAPAIETGILAMERVHDVVNDLLFAQARLNAITTRFKTDINSVAYREALAAGGYVTKASTTTKALVSRARITNFYLRPRALNPIIENSAAAYKDQAESMKVKIDCHCPSDIKVNVDVDHFERILRNLFSNSLYFLETDQKPAQRNIRIEVTSDPERGVVDLLFWDNGPGISPMNLDKVFRYFFTSRRDKGLGFGLAIAQRIIRQHKGSMSVSSKFGSWTEFKITLPSL